VVGDGPYLSEMTTNMKGLPVRFTGALSGEALKRMYASCDIFVFPSATDTFGNVVLEAQASGLPVIVTDQGGPMENMVDGKTGLVVRAGDSQSLAKAMDRLARNPERVRTMGRAARDHMESRSFEEAFLKTWSLYAQPEAIASIAQAG
jgi:glycosyltransferase involved in cell wall biosynthesis